MISVAGTDIETLFSETEIAEAVERIAKELTDTVEGDVIIVSVLKGAFVFTADLVRALHRQGMSPEVEFVSLSSYGGGTTGGDVRLLRDIERPVAGKTVLLVDDILESGRTVRFARELMAERGATETRLVVLLDKAMRRKVEIEADHVGFSCPDHFVVGYGLDAGHRFRELPFVGRVVD
ncbi:MAG: hypoxanthine phosphoribosyltransferase [Fulvimarina manganoxydans]|uniref:hypoxanthine phosphoribosyltransferase n=1 Tax=Fulvimarina manganoxydans TaxID=937218 RepID=UPI002355C7BB|nr:hypoxanthine phosphoribosyltransferase [Fulvimarina manganoxydans]MCK5934920.1 hypoxanthine phosphoribosyltransferase [Fulvimarina manganoxydans]MEE2950003.1 hypoxanthine phosphoribosyltransferase [Pseudomonadota bacterium]